MASYMPVFPFFPEFPNMSLYAHAPAPVRPGTRSRYPCRDEITGNTGKTGNFGASTRFDANLKREMTGNISRFTGNGGDDVPV